MISNPEGTVLAAKRKMGTDFKFNVFAKEYTPQQISARKLQNRIAQDTAGIGLCLHPGIEVIGDFDYEIKGNQGIPMAYTVHDFGVTRHSDQTRKEYNFDDGGEFLIEMYSQHFVIVPV